jgi:phenylalanine-4-hydroxylase
MIINPYIVHLDADHPGFKDDEYRKRRDFIAIESEKYNGTIESIPIIKYTEKEINTWKYVYDKLIELSPYYAFSEHIIGLSELEICRDEIPQLRYITEIMVKKTGFQMVPVKGLIPGKIFMQSFAEGFFYSTQYVRHHSTPGFTPEPDIIHEILGHASGLYSKIVSKIAKEIGKAALKTDDQEKLKKLENIYWFVIEYGLVKEDGKVKTFGAGNLSSFIDLKRCVEDKECHKPFDIEVIANTSYDPTITQKTLFLAESFEDCYNQVRDYCNSLL